MYIEYEVLNIVIRCKSPVLVKGIFKVVCIQYACSQKGIEVLFGFQKLVQGRLSDPKPNSLAFVALKNPFAHMDVVWKICRLSAELKCNQITYS